MLKRIKQLRNEMGISQRQLGEIVGISQQSVNKYENHNIEPDLQTLIDIADYFDTSVDYIIEHTDKREVRENLSGQGFTIKEKKLLEKYRKLNTSEKESIELIINNYLAAVEN